MSKRTTRPDTDTGRPGPLTRLASTVVWYAPELTGVAASAGAAATVWAPLGAIGAALGAWIATDQVNIARARRQYRHARTQGRGERAQLDAAEDNAASDDAAHEHAGDDTVSGDVSATDTATDTATGASTAEGRSGWEVAG